ncbi:MAG TPA: porin [Microvirga sp.]|nr:porin [Microvirga sp.]
MRRHIIALALTSLALSGTAAAGPRETAAGCPPGFAALQNSNTCVRISGRVRADALVGSARTRSSDAIETQASGRVQLDVRTRTEYGPLRAVIRAEGVRRSHEP